MDLEELLSKSLGPGKVTAEDMAARPGSGEVYLAVSIGANKTPAIVAVITTSLKQQYADLWILR